jgi:hypothetical protein
MANIKTAINLTVEGGQPVYALSDEIAAEAVSYLIIDLARGDTDLVVEVQPSVSSQLHLMLLTSSIYTSDLTYRFSDGSTDAAVALTLDGPHLYSAGNLAAFGVDPLQIKLTLAGAGEDAQVSLFVARDATP